MIIEDFGKSGAERVYDRFDRRGRLMQPGLEYVNSWVEVGLRKCYQVVEAEDRGPVDAWTANWSDLVDFEVIEVVSSARAHELVRTRKS